MMGKWQKTLSQKSAIHNFPTMKHNHHHPAPAPGSAPKLVTVRFEFTLPEATHVCIAGTFNDWKPGAHPLNSSGEGTWWQVLSLPPGTYEYCLVVDGKWMPDPLARETVPNPFGGQNSILNVTGDPAADHLADAENIPMKKEIQKI
jgi:1,4-alpha-glucan branching enzyme